MKAWCEQCGKYVDYVQEVEHTEALEIKGTRFNVSQTYGICPVCGEEVLSNALEDLNVHRAHNAYRRAIDSITSEEIKALLDKYNIGAQPLSLLLGWGANTIERQMKHTIPSKEHARRLRELQDPRNMLELLEKNAERISTTAYKKAYHAVLEYLPIPGFDMIASVFSAYHGYVTAMREVFNGLIMTATNCKTSEGKATYTETSKPSKRNYRYAFIGRNI